MSNERSPRALCSITIGTRGIGFSLHFLSHMQPCGCASALYTMRNRRVAKVFRGANMMPTTDHIAREVVLPVAPEDAWDALVRPEELTAWLADEVDADGPLDE